MLAPPIYDTDVVALNLIQGLSDERQRHSGRSDGLLQTGHQAGEAAVSAPRSTVASARGASASVR
jgi:hypothetical protein